MWIEVEGLSFVATFSVFEGPEKFSGLDALNFLEKLLVSRCLNFVVTFSALKRQNFGETFSVSISQGTF